ncbi:MAG: 3-dehydroquinate synthase [Hyphomicrobiales bacterium]|nr:MAG: 3-dehydroquinate synthase [Hyphomicrobiales bacterium]
MDTKPNAAKTVHIDLGSRSYDILIGDGLIAGAGAEIASRFPNARMAIVTDEIVASLHLATLTEGFEAAGIEYQVFTLAPGEATKSFANYEKLAEAILAGRFERGDFVVALGGGVIGDLAGFVAASVRRGMNFLQIPTTLLAQVDSSVGGKTGINTRQGKNLLGAFYQPRLVLADTGALATLPARHFRAGYAEVMKYGLIDDAGFFEWLEANHDEIFARGPAASDAIATSCRAKARVVAADEREMGNRALLNLGHTFGHAFEAGAGYNDSLVHGEAVGLGIAMAFRFSTRLGLCPANDPARVETHLKASGLPTRIADLDSGPFDTDMLMRHIAQDKKVSRGTLTFILARGIGKSFIAKDIDPNDVRAFIDAEQTL